MLEEVHLAPGAKLTVRAEEWKKDIVLDGFALEPLTLRKSNMELR